MAYYYDPRTGHWAMAGSRDHEVTAQPRLSELDRLSPAQAWPCLLELLAAVPDDLVDLVGTKPLETFIVRHVGAFAAEFAGRARTAPRFLDAALNVNLTRGELPAAAEAEMLAAFGPRVRLLEPDGDG